MSLSSGNSRHRYSTQSLAAEAALEMDAARNSSPRSIRGRTPLLPPEHASSSDGTVPPGLTRESRGAPPRWSVIMLTLVGGIGGFLFGYDTGVISGALPYLRDDMLVSYARGSRLNWLQGIIVSAAVAGAAVGSAAGGWLSDRIGRRTALLVGDLLFTLGAALMAAALQPNALILGRVLVGLGVGLASVTVPVYIAESVPKGMRATLITVNVLMITTGQFVAYLVDWLFTFVPGTWRWMLGVAGLPSLVQFVGLLFLPESPRWLAAHGRLPEAEAVLHRLRAPEEAERDARELADLTHAEHAAPKQAIGTVLRTPEVQAELRLGLGLQILQQLAGINTVMYFTPAILELAGFRDKRQALLVAMLPAGVNALGTLVGMWAIDRGGRR